MDSGAARTILRHLPVDSLTLGDPSLGFGGKVKGVNTSRAFAGCTIAIEGTLGDPNTIARHGNGTADATMRILGVNVVSHVFPQPYRLKVLVGVGATGSVVGKRHANQDLGTIFRPSQSCSRVIIALQADNIQARWSSFFRYFIYFKDSHTPASVRGRRDDSRKFESPNGGGF